jgi:outer membrane protein assembly factor BamB
VDVPISYGNATFSPEPLRVVKGQLLVKTHIGPLYAMDAKSGKMSWTIPAEDLWKLDPQVSALGVAVVINGDDVWMHAGRNVYKVVGR